MSIINTLIVLAIIVASMTLHEIMHGLVAYFLGDTTAKEDGRLTLNPIKHLDPIMSVVLPLICFLMGGIVFGGAKPVPVNFSRLKGGVWGMAAVAFAGPLTNLLIAFILFLVGHYTGWMYEESNLLYFVISRSVVINLGFAVFNMLPIPPLDGSRVLYAFMPDFVRDFMVRIERVGIIIVYVLILIGGGFSTAMLGRVINWILNGFYWIVGL